MGPLQYGGPCRIRRILTDKQITKYKLWSTHDFLETRWMVAMVEHILQIQVSASVSSTLSWFSSKVPDHFAIIIYFSLFWSKIGAYRPQAAYGSQLSLWPEDLVVAYMPVQRLLHLTPSCMPELCKDWLVSDLKIR